ncbi:MAG: PEP-CTERM sorting domain-containing protein [Verrucomicrobiales bacterium]|nr:PEP-CTERM sorting domain-containing protein [Verrucomicrobiales bacterium]
MGNAVLKILRTAAAVLAFSLAMRAQVFLKFEEVNLPVPDGSLLGVVDSHEVSGLPDGEIASLQVWLELSEVGDGGYAGDLHIALWHDGARAVLLNRPGRTAANGSGYSDTGDMDITLSAIATGDLHLYREVLGDSGTPLVGRLEGTWQADGRDTDPLTVLDTDARTAGLGVFEGMDPNGIWALLAVDASSGGTVQLDSWGLMITPVPEPVATVPAMAVGLVLWGCVRRRRTRCRPPVGPNAGRA